MAMRDIARYYGLEHIGKGLLKLSEYADSIWGADKPIYMRPSFYVFLGSSIVAPAIALWKRFSWSTREAVYIVGGYVSTKVWDWIEEAVGGFFKTAAVKAAPTPTTYIPPKPATTQGQAGSELLRKP
jgi:hypothetical protein